MKVLPALLTALMLTACQDPQARRENAALQVRVDALEEQVRTLRSQTASADAGALTARAAAQTCANSLTRALESFRQDSVDHRYPTPAQLALPDECVDQHVNWVARTAGAYTFTVTDESGKELARQSGS